MRSVQSQAREKDSRPVDQFKYLPSPCTVDSYKSRVSVFVSEIRLSPKGIKHVADAVDSG